MNRKTRYAATAGVTALTVGIGGGGCLSRPVVNREPAVNIGFHALDTSRTIDKVDILFDIDNSASMGDKQAYLGQAIPDLVNRFVNPGCYDPMGNSHGPSAAGVCPAGSSPEFAPVHDLHLGIVSSSLGSRGGGDLCLADTPASNPFGKVLAHDDDQAHLLNRTLTFNGASVAEGTVADAPAADPFLYWFPATANQGKTPGPGQAVTDAGALVTDFTSLVQGTGVFGCGIESQLESWYRFLVVQPGPVREHHDHDRRERQPARPVAGRRHDDPPPAPRLPAPGLAGPRRRPDGRERLRDRRAVPSRPGRHLDERRGRASAGHRGLLRTRVARLPVVRAEQQRCHRPGLQGVVHLRPDRDERLGLQRQSPPRPHEGQVRRRPAVSHPALRHGPDLTGRADR